MICKINRKDDTVIALKINVGLVNKEQNDFSLLFWELILKIEPFVLSFVSLMIYSPSSYPIKFTLFAKYKEGIKSIINPIIPILIPI